VRSPAAGQIDSSKRYHPASARRPPRALIGGEDLCGWALLTAPCVSFPQASLIAPMPFWRSSRPVNAGHVEVEPGSTLVGVDRRDCVA